MTTMYISPEGSGKRDGSSPENAAGIGALDKMIVKAGAGGTVVLAADKGPYNISGTLNLYHGGADGAPVTIKGMDSHGNPMNAEFVGTRPENYTPGAPSGNEIFKLLSGSNHLNFENMDFKNVGTAFRVGADVQNIRVAHVEADNVARFFENYASGSAKTATISGLVIEDVDVHGFSKGCIRLKYDTHDVIIRNVRGDSERMDGDNFAIGVHLDNTVHNVLVSETAMLNAHDSTSSYWNGDGFATERGVYNVRFVNTYAAGNTDGGYDLKSTATILEHAVAEDNKRNFRIWGDGVTMIDCVSVNPHTRGGTGGASDVWVAANSHVTINNFLVADGNSGAYVFDLSERNARVVLDDPNLILDPATRLMRAGVGSGVTYVDGPPLITPYDDRVICVMPTFGVKQEPAVFSMAVGNTVAEGDSGNTDIQVTITRSGKLTAASTVDFVVEGYGASPVDGQDFVGGVLPSGRINFPAGVTSITITLHVAGDHVVEASEGFRVRIVGVDSGEVAVEQAEFTLTNDDVAPVLTVLDRAHSVDLSASTNDVIGPDSGRSIYFVDNSATVSGRDRIADFGHDDVLLTTRALYDSNRDGIINFSANGLSVDGRGGTDTVVLGGANSLRDLGVTDDGLHVYADYTTRPRGAVEGTLADNVLQARGTSSSTAYFFDTALDLNLGDDRIAAFRATDLLVTTTRIEDIYGVVLAGANGRFELPGGTGGAHDTYYIPGEGGSVAITADTGAALTALEFDGTVQRDGVTYYVYSQLGSMAGTGDLQF